MPLFLILALLISGKCLAQIPPMPSMYKLVASEQRIPAKLFYALILNESRSASKQKEKSKILPWPWTVNHRGRSHFFQTRMDAYKYVDQLTKRNDLNFDIGLGQINWYWHKGKFSSLWEAFDPYTNLTISAAYLREQYDRPECNAWELAVGCYHRPAQKVKDKRIARAYTSRVINLWKRI